MRRMLLIGMYLLGIVSSVAPDAFAACCTSGDGKATCCGTCCGAGPTTCMADNCT